MRGEVCSKPTSTMEAWTLLAFMEGSKMHYMMCYDSFIIAYHLIFSHQPLYLTHLMELKVEDGLEIISLIWRTCRVVICQGEGNTHFSCKHSMQSMPSWHAHALLQVSKSPHTQNMHQITPQTHALDSPKHVESWETHCLFLSSNYKPTTLLYTWVKRGGGGSIQHPCRTYHDVHA